ncbi:MAG: hypothetical protein GWP58_08975 [Gammaproteobacteria bacterium]|nr:hypothetical protein [Gammaproteobacteria bacterium]
MKRYLTGCIRPGVFALVLFVLHGCASMSPEEQEAKRVELDKMGDETIAALLEKHPEAQEALELALGYVVIDLTATKIPVFGAGGGSGVIVDKRSGRKSYVKVSRFEVGGGLGAQKYKVIVFFEDEKLLDRAIKGAWHFEAGAEVAAGSSGSEGKVTPTDKGYRAFKIVEGGAVATVTIRVARATPYLKQAER